MNKNKNLTDKRFKITITEEGMKLNQSVPLSEIINTTIRGLLSVCLGITNDENRETIYAQLSTAFANTLASYAPDLYFPSEEELAKELELMEVAAKAMPDITEDIESIKDDIKTRIKYEDALRPGESALFDESGVIHFEMEETPDAETTNEAETV